MTFLGRPFALPFPWASQLAHLFSVYSVQFPSFIVAAGGAAAGGWLQMNDYYSLHKCSAATCFTALCGSADIWLSGPSKYFYWVLTIILICICAAAARHPATPGSCHELVTFMTQEWCYYVTQYLNHRPFSSCLLLQWWQKHAIINGETVCLIHYLLLSRPSLRRVESVININK